MTISAETIDMIHALLKGCPAGMETSEILRGLRNRGIKISYLDLEDWLHDEESVQQADGGGFRLSHDFSATHLQKRRVIPESGESLDSVDDALVWPRLIDYYINCIKEEGKKVYSYRMHQNSSFVLLNKELVSAGERFASIARKDQPDFLKTISNRSVFYGYPLYLEWIDSRDSDFCDYKITPVFIVRLETKEDPASAIFQFTSQHVRLNPEILTKLRWKDRAHLEKVLDASEENYSRFEERVALASAELSELGIAEELDPARIVRAKNLQILEEQKPGIYNLCGLFSTGADPYNKRLLGELEQVRELPVERIKTSSLASLLRTKKQNLAETVAPPADTCIFPGIGDSLLNAEQSTAVTESFNYPISVVTGPPGSGKSEVVAALVINAVLNDMSVLFASRNNKAVQVVQERLEELSGPHGLIRVGGSHDQQVIQVLDRMEALPMNHDGSFSSLWSVCQQLMDELDILEKRILKWGELIHTSSIVNESFDGMKRQHMRGVADSEEKISNIDLNVVVEASRWLSNIHNDYKRGAKTAAWLKFKFGAKRGKVLLGLLKTELEKAELDVESGFPRNMKETGPLLLGILTLVDLLKAFEQVQSAHDAIAKAGDLDEILEQTAEARSRLAKQVPVLLEKKVRENTAGPQQDDDADDSLASFRENYKKLIKSKMDDEQRDIRAAIQAQTFGSVLRRLPAWSVTNLSVGGRIPLQSGVFDLVIIDEASQCDIASCIPLLVRSKRGVVIGDPLQLSQISNVSSVAEQQFLAEQQLNHPMFDHLIYSQKSIYDAARHVVPGRSYTFLSNHYRCGSDIIEFANSAHWYDERLEVFTDEGALKRPDWWKKGIIWEGVESGSLAGGKKYMLPDEIDRAVALVKELEVRNYEGTVGIVCPFRDMTDRIRDAIFGGDISAHFLKGTNLEVQTAHGFQGDARDVIIYVMGIHPDMPSGKVWFISDENSNLFNVALSRAKASFIVVGSRTAVSNLNHKKEPVRYLRDFVVYVDGLETKEDQPEDTSGDPEFSPEQLWEEKFYKDSLKPAGINVISQYRVGPYRLDFGLLHQGRKLDIEVDGERWHKDAGGNRLEKDIDRNIYVKAQGWDVMRFWVYELKEDMGKCLKKIEQWMNSSE
ncbi:MAG: AAA family ATPase [Anaerolineaceae bacterium]|nr:AAA family ATPase [Anaerolineaceae bacterium]